MQGARVPYLERCAIMAAIGTDDDDYAEHARPCAARSQSLLAPAAAITARPSAADAGPIAALPIFVDVTEGATWGAAARAAALGTVGAPPRTTGVPAPAQVGVDTLPPPPVGGGGSAAPPRVRVAAFAGACAGALLAALG